MNWKKTQKDWRFWKWFVGIAIISICWIHTVSGHEERIKKIEDRMEGLTRVEQRVNDIADWFNVPERRPPND